jgi:hypothetical protein
MKSKNGIGVEKTNGAQFKSAQECVFFEGNMERKKQFVAEII